MTTTATLPLAAARPRTSVASGAPAVEMKGVSVVRGGATLLQGVTLAVQPGELVAVIGASGAGKSTLLTAMAGINAGTVGSVRIHGEPAGAGNGSRIIGYVPQDDLIHRELPVRRTLRYAAQLRLPARTPIQEIDRSVDETLRELGLADQATQRVADLSGGQRKRTSIAAELLTRPRVLFLDEPTSGLDPATAVNLMGTLRRLADHGTTIVLTTHNLNDVHSCDRLLVVADGHVAFTGSPAEAREQLGMEHLPEGDDRPLGSVSLPYVDDRRSPGEPTSIGPDVSGAAAPTSGLTQWRVLSRRSTDLLLRNRLTLAIMLGAPALVTAMFAMLFQAGALDSDSPDATAAVSTTYWLAFAAFFFGLTYGLLQICTELAILRRERFVGLRIGPYLASKVTVLAPVLAAVNLAMLVVLRLLDRLPPLSSESFGRLAVTLTLTSLAALALGLLASAAVADPTQATLALPMLCFPAVLFAGAVLPLPDMDITGRAMSVLVVARWAFEAAGRSLGLESLLSADPTGTGAVLLDEHGDAFAGGVIGHWSILVLMATALLAATAFVLHRRTAAA